jgi:hypothetical protein
VQCILLISIDISGFAELTTINMQKMLKASGSIYSLYVICSKYHDKNNFFYLEKIDWVKYINKFKVLLL